MALTRLGPNQLINLASNVTGTLPTGNGGTGATSFAPGKVLQVVKSTVTTSTIETTSSTPSEISSDMRVTLTPSSTSSKILIQFFFTFLVGNTTSAGIGIYRSINGGAYSKVSDGNGNEAFRQRLTDGYQVSTTLINYDAPSTTSQVIYTPYFWRQSGSSTVRVNDNGMGSFTLATEVAS